VWQREEKKKWNGGERRGRGREEWQKNGAMDKEIHEFNHRVDT
jgi:hypothetical protein